MIDFVAMLYPRRTVVVAVTAYGTQLTKVSVYALILSIPFFLLVLCIIAHVLLGYTRLPYPTCLTNLLPCLYFALFLR